MNKAMTARVVRLLIVLVACSLLICSASAETFYVGDDAGWIVPATGSAFYAAWAAQYTFIVGDVLVFNFTTGQQDVARVTKEAFLTCNSTDPIANKTNGPANFTLDSAGIYYFIGTIDKHCIEGQRLAINVTAPRGSGPLNYTVGDEIGWIVPPGRDKAYKKWADRKIFLVGDNLVFWFINGTQDVALVTAQVYDSCNISSTISVWSTSPAIVRLNATGEYFFTSTYPRHCELGQKLAINVTNTNTYAVPPSSGGSNPATAGGPAPLPVSSAPSGVVAEFFITMFFLAMALF